ncbi:MAG: fructose bisphosphate aldolase [Bacilli bacterium]|jgi:fructose-bisphosphate aldolase, class I
MNKEQEKIMHSNQGFIAALDQSGGSTPKALLGYGITANDYNNEEEMFGLIHKMRTRVITSPSFTSKEILGAILFEKTMDSEIDGKLTADYLWENKHIVPFLKIDKGLADEVNGVRVMKPMPTLDDLLKKAVKRHIFGTKERSVINAANPEGIKEVVAQQFEVAKKVISYGLVPIVEPEVTISILDKKEAEDILLKEIENNLKILKPSDKIILKLSLPTVAGLYDKISKDPHIVRVVALSGGYSRDEANKLLKKNKCMIASFSRALLNDLRVQQSDDDFNAKLKEAIDSIYNASCKK